MIFNEHCSYYGDGLGESLLYEIKEMCSNNELELWIKNFLNLKIVTEKDTLNNEKVTYPHHPRTAQHPTLRRREKTERTLSRRG
jgi:hypothetical protein